MSVNADRLKPGFSLYCDILRFLAAATVLLGHASWGNLGGGFFWRAQVYGHPAVMVFFVLSGYIISYVCFTRENTLGKYSAARLARLYSVVIPAIVLAFILDTIGRAHDPAVYQAIDESHPVLRALSAGLFLSESWFAEVTLFSNSPYWSLPYEFWYYVLFGAAIFLRGKTRIAAVAISALIAGPKILMAFPIWLAGAAAYQASRKAPLGKGASLVLFAVSLAVTLLGLLARLQGVLPILFSPYLPLQFSWADYVMGLGIALNLYAASGFELPLLQRFKTIIRETAGMTFSLYLFHLPVLFFASAFLPRQMPALVRYLLLIAAGLIVPALLSRVTEDRKDALRRGFDGLFRRLQLRGSGA